MTTDRPNSVPCRILLIGGSLRAGSTNVAVLATAESTAPLGVTTQMYSGLAELPPFNPDDDHDPLPPAAERLRALLASPANGGAKAAHDTLRVVLGYVGAELVTEACVRLPVRRDAIGANGAIEDPQLRAAIAEALGALAKHVAARTPSGSGAD